MIGMVFLGLGHGLIFPSSAGAVKEKTKGSESGIATGTFYALIVAGVAIGAPISTHVYEVFNAQITLGSYRSRGAFKISKKRLILSIFSTSIFIL